MKVGLTRWYRIYLGVVPFGHPTYMNAESIVVQFFTSGVISEMWGDEVVHDILGGSSF